MKVEKLVWSALGWRKEARSGRGRKWRAGLQKNGLGVERESWETREWRAGPN